MARQYIDSQQSYTKLRDQLYSHTTKQSKDGIRATKSGLYVKNKVSRPWFGSGKARAQKYMEAKNSITAAINSEFDGVKIDGKRLGDYVMGRLNDPTKIRMKDLRLIDAEIAGALRKWDGGNPTKRDIAAIAADMLDNAADGDSSVKNRNLTHWRQAAPGLERMNMAVQFDLHARNEDHSYVMAQQVMRNAGVRLDRGLTGANLQRTVAYLEQKHGVPAPHVRGLGKLVDLDAKCRVANSDMAARNAYFRKHATLCADSGQKVLADNLKQLADLSTTAMAGYKKFIDFAGLNNRKRREVHEALKIVADLALQQAQNSPASREEFLRRRGLTAADVAKMSFQDRQELEDILARTGHMTDELLSHAACCLDMAMSLMPRAERYGPTRPDLLFPEFIPEENDLKHAVFESLGRFTKKPEDLYAGSRASDTVALSGLNKAVDRFGEAMRHVRNWLEDFQDDPTDENLVMLERSLQEASTAGDYLLLRFEKASKLGGASVDAQTEDERKLDGPLSALREQKDDLHRLAVMAAQETQRRGMIDPLDANEDASRRSSVASDASKASESSNGSEVSKASHASKSSESSSVSGHSTGSDDSELPDLFEAAKAVDSRRVSHLWDALNAIEEQKPSDLGDALEESESADLAEPSDMSSSSEATEASELSELSRAPAAFDPLEAIDEAEPLELSAMSAMSDMTDAPEPSMVSVLSDEPEAIDEPEPLELSNASEEPEPSQSAHVSGAPDAFDDAASDSSIDSDDLPELRTLRPGEYADVDKPQANDAGRDVREDGDPTTPYADGVAGHALPETVREPDDAAMARLAADDARPTTLPETRRATARAPDHLEARADGGVAENDAAERRVPAPPALGAGDAVDGPLLRDEADPEDEPSLDDADARPLRNAGSAENEPPRRGADDVQANASDDVRSEPEALVADEAQKVRPLSANALSEIRLPNTDLFSVSEYPEIKPFYDEDFIQLREDLLAAENEEPVDVEQLASRIQDQLALLEIQRDVRELEVGPDNFALRKINQLIGALQWIEKTIGAELPGDD